MEQDELSHDGVKEKRKHSTGSLKRKWLPYWKEEEKMFTLQGGFPIGGKKRGIFLY
jgi:hypothetical protein